ncbi:Chromosome segregation ATPase [Methanosarcina siciliae T4/M]|uniref:Chromosome segregation ATPase n=2 Tax=Methanosarcina siciliae TaxID=38027 RepID=A0A0E3P217_9EURY|nr:Chromosome segregation ATPase [Methanosarcina siciliae T4/M]
MLFMKYIYQDSTELPVQRDFIEDLKSFIDITARVIPLENSIIEIKCKNKEALHELNNRITGMDIFEEKLSSLVKKLARDIGTEDLMPCADSILITCNENFGKKREILEIESRKIESGAAQEYQKIETKVLEALTPFLISGIYGAEKRFELSSSVNGVSGEMEGSVSGLQYYYKLWFTEEPLTVERLIGSLSLPVWTKTGILRKEEKIKMQDLSEFLVISLEYDSEKNVRIILENKKANRKFRIEGGGLKYFVYEDEREITEDKDLGGYIDMRDLAKIPEKVQNYLRENLRTYTLSKVLLDEEDAVSTNQIFDCLKVIAEQYGVIVHECLARGHNKEEITIKMEKADGTRTEKYISKTEMYTRLSDVGSEGVEIAEILGVDSRAQIKDSKYLIA